MPKDSKGNFHLNSQRAMAADKMPGKPRALAAGMKKPGAAPMDKPDMSDGLGPDGANPDHEGAISDGMSMMHNAMGGRHMHVHEGEDGKMTTHHIDHDGALQGPHEHPDLESVKQHMEKVFNEGHGGMSGGGEDCY